MIYCPMVPHPRNIWWSVLEKSLSSEKTKKRHNSTCWSTEENEYVTGDGILLRKKISQHLSHNQVAWTLENDLVTWSMWLSRKSCSTHRLKGHWIMPVKCGSSNVRMRHENITVCSVELKGPVPLHRGLLQKQMWPVPGLDSSIHTRCIVMSMFRWDEQVLFTRVRPTTKQKTKQCLKYAYSAAHTTDVLPDLIFR